MYSSRRIRPGVGVCRTCPIALLLIMWEMGKLRVAPPIEISGISPIRNLWNAPLDLPPSNNTNRDPTQFGTTQLFVPPGTGHAPKLQNGPGRESPQGLGTRLVNAQDYGGSLQFLDSPTSLAHQAEKVGSARTKVNVGPGH